MIISLTSLKGQGKDTVAKIIKALDWYHNRDKDYLKTKYSDTEFALRVLNGESMEYSSFENKKFADSLKGILTILLNCKMSDFEDREFKEKTLGPEWWVWKQYTDDSPNYTLHPYIENEIPPKDSILFKPTVRYLLQFIGTDLLRNQLNPNIWVNNLLSQYNPRKEERYSCNEYNSDYIYSPPILLERYKGNKDLFKCCCGNEFKADRNKVKSGHTKSCGCYKRYQHGKKQYKDGRKGTRLWSIYNNMIQRCENKKNPQYHNYGGRGIQVSVDFKPYEKFKEWSLNNGYDDLLTINRINNDGNYEPSNCEFVNYSKQAINTRIRKDNTSGFRGVIKDKHGWRADININKKSKFLGYFNTPKEASIAYEIEYEKREKLYDFKYSNQKKWIISDTRFLNEIQAIKKVGNPYILVKIERITDKKDFHISELELEDYRGYNYVIDNNGTIIDLIEQVKKILVTENIIKI